MTRFTTKCSSKKLPGHAEERAFLTTKLVFLDSLYYLDIDFLRKIVITPSEVPKKLI